MPSRADRRPRVGALAALLAALLPAGAATQEPPPHAGAERPGRVEIARALDAVKADPNLAAERTVKTLRWRGSNAPASSSMPGWLLWFGGLFRWFAESARLVMWCAVAALVGLLVVFVVRLVRGTALPKRAAPMAAPTHVRDLDIRPESLPRDIGAAARALWDRGEHRAALALLYRGLLSRLAHVHGIPIRDSTTEGDCLALAGASDLSARTREFVSQLVRVWQRAVYGREDVQAATVYSLCSDFGSTLDLQSGRGPAARTGAR